MGLVKDPAWAPYYPFSWRGLDVRGHRMHYVDEGSGPTVVMIHGNPTWSFYYRELIKILRPNYRCLAPDHIGMGLSDKPSPRDYPYTLMARIDDLEEFLRLAAPKGPLTLIVHDWGGMIGMGWAVRHPERIERIVAMNTGCFRMPRAKSFPWPLRLARTGLGAFLIRGGDAFASVAARVCAVKRPLTRELRRAYTAPYDSWDNRVATLRFVQDIPLSALDPSWSTVVDTEEQLHCLSEVPMFLPWGMKDWVFDDHFLRGWQARFPKAQVRRFEDCGHYLLEDAPEAIAMIAEFLGRRSQGAAA